ncbi:Pof6 interactor protein 1 [Fusarium oxysporum f. sp. albedinis]|nr:Pof6 interactor protein 1 [Fusarium oxysporum f. sp. albedinis]
MIYVICSPRTGGMMPVTTTARIRNRDVAQAKRVWGHKHNLTLWIIIHGISCLSFQPFEPLVALGDECEGGGRDDDDLSGASISTLFSLLVIGHVLGV